MNQWWQDISYGAGKANWGSDRIRVKSDWKAISLLGESYDQATELSNKFVSGTEASAVISELCLTCTVDQLTYYNPSIFGSDGRVKQSANWDKFDIPGGSASISTQ